MFLQVGFEAVDGMDRWMDGWTGGRMDGWMEGNTDVQINQKMMSRPYEDFVQGFR